MIHAGRTLINTCARHSAQGDKPIIVCVHARRIILISEAPLLFNSPKIRKKIAYIPVREHADVEVTDWNTGDFVKEENIVVIGT